MRGKATATLLMLALGLIAANSGMVPPAEAQGQTDLPAARKEGKLVWYTSTPVENATRIAKMFEAQTQIKVELFRTGGSAALRRFMQEVEAGRVLADVLTTSDPGGFGSLVKRGLLVPFKPAGWELIPDSAKDKDGHFFAQRLNLMSIYARSDKVAAADLPQTWDDLVQPKYKGRMVLTDPSYTSLQLSVVGMIARIKGWGYYEKLARNDIMVVQGNQQAAEAIRRAERVIAVGASDSYATDDRKRGVPVVTIFPTDGVFVIPSPTGLVKGSASPNAARLFASFMLTEPVQALFPQEGGYAARTDMPPPAGNPPLGRINAIAVDYDYIEAEGARIKKRFAEVFQ